MAELVQTEETIPFFEYRQNNSGGSFVYDEAAGISHIVLVQAPDYNRANVIAESIGLYFDGDGDCDCCGSRWSDASSWDKPTYTPSVYGEPVKPGDPFPEDEPDGFTPINWMAPNNEGFIHYADGRIEKFW